MMKRLLPVVLIVWTLVACGPNDHALTRRLDLAESLLWSCPDSSLALVETTGRKTMVSPSVRARHALLTVQSRSRCRIPATNDSLILTALDYYKRHASVHPGHLLRAWLYYADVLMDLERNEAALAALLEAEKLVREDTPLPYRFLLESNLGYINRRSDLHTRALVHHRNAFELAEHRNDTVWMMTALANLINLPGYDTLDIARRYPVERFDRLLSGLPATLRSKLWQNAGVWYCHHGDTLQAIGYYHHALQADSTRTSTLLALATLHEQSGQTLSADSLYRKILDCGTPAQKSRVHQLLSGRYADKTDYRKAAEHYREHTEYARQVLAARDTRRILELQIEQERLQAAYRAYKRTTLLVAVITVLAVSLILVAYKVRNLIRRHREKLLRQVAAAAELEQEKEQLSGRVDLQQKYLNRYKTICRIESDRNRIETADLAALNLMLTLRDGSYVLQKDKDYNDLFRWADLAYNNYHKRIHTTYAGLTENDLALCCLLRSGADITRCAAIMGCSEAAVRKRIQRMYPVLGIHSRSEYLAIVQELPC